MRRSVAYRATLPPPRELRDLDVSELMNEAAQGVTFAMQNLDECAGAILQLMELKKKYPGEIPEFGSIPGAWTNLDRARRALDVARFKFKNGGK